MMKLLHSIVVVLLLTYSTSCKVNKTSIASTKNNTSTTLTNNDKQSQLSSLFIEGCSNRLLGKFKEAEWYLKQCERLEPSSAAVQYELSNLYRLSNRKQEALIAAQKAVQLNPDNIWYQYALIKVYEQNNQYHKSISVLKNLIKKFPNNQDLYRQLVLEYELNNQPEKAIELLEETEKKWGNSFDLMYEKVTLLFFMGKPKAVENELQKYLKQFPNDLKAKEVLASMLYKNKEYEKALALSDDLLKEDSLNATAHLVYYDYYISQNNIEKAFFHLNILFSNPDYDVKDKLSILINLYSSSIKSKDKDLDEKLLRVCEIFVHTHPMSPESHSIYADYLLKQDKKSEAIAEYYKAALLSKNKYPIWDQLLSIEYEAAWYDSLLRHSEMALEIFPNQSMFYVYKAIALKNKKQYEEAIHYYKIATDYALDNNNLLEIIYTELAETYHDTKNYEESDKYFEYALTINPDNSLVLNNYAYYLAVRKQKLEKAEKMSKRSLELSPNNPNYIDTYAWILYQQKRYKEAESTLKSILDKKQSPTLLEHYGDILYKLNRKEDALEYWKKSKEAGNTSETLIKKIETQTLLEE